MAVPGGGGLGRDGPVAQRADSLEQLGLVAFELGDERGSTMVCSLESFFDSAGRRP